MKHFTHFKSSILRGLLSLFFLTAMVSSAWGEEKTVTWTASTGAFGSAISSVNGTATGNISTGSYQWNYTRTLTALTSKKSDCCQMSNGYMQCGSNNAANDLVLTTSNIPGTIKTIVINCASNGTSPNPTHTLFVTVGGDAYTLDPSTVPFPTLDNGIITKAGGADVTATGQSSGNISISFVGGDVKKALYIKSISVTYDEEGGSSTPTPTQLSAPTDLSSSNVTATTATLSWNTVANASSYTLKIGEIEYTNANSPYPATGLTAGTQYSWSVKAIGDEINYSSSDYASKANFTTEAATHTVSWNVNGETSTEEVAEGSTINFPSEPEAINGYTFVGWSESIVTTTDTKPTLVTSANMETSDKVFYAVFALREVKGDPFWKKITNANDVVEGTYAIISYDGAYYLPNEAATSSAPKAKEVSKTDDVINVVDDMKWTLRKENNKYTFESVAESGKYLWGAAQTSEGIRVNTTSSKSGSFNQWTHINTKDYGLVLKDAGSSGRYLSTYDSQDWRNYTSTSLVNRAANLYFLDPNETFSNYCTTISNKTVLGIPSNLASNSITNTTATLTWSAVSNADSYLVKIGDKEYEATTCTYSATGLSAEQTYSWSVKAVANDNNAEYSTSVYAPNAYFTTTPNTYTITLANAENGTYIVKNGDETISNESLIFAHSVLSVEATPDEGYSFCNWEVYKGETLVYSSDNLSNKYSFEANSDITIKVYFDAIPTYTVTFNVNGVESELTETIGGTGVTPIAPSNIGDYTFAGWKTSPISEETSASQSFVELTDGKYMPNDNITLYAVFSHEKESTSDAQYRIYAQVGDKKCYMSSFPIASKTTINQILSSENVSEAKIYEIKEAEGDQYTISYEEGTTKYLCCTRTGSSNNYNYYLQSCESPYNFTRSNGSKGTYRFATTYNGRVLAYKKDDAIFRIYASSNFTGQNSDLYYDLELEKVSSIIATYYATSIIESVTISSVGYATYVTSSAINFDACDGITAYKVSVDEEKSKVTLNPIAEAPANEAIVVAGEAGTYNVPVIASATALEDNDLTYSETALAVTETYKHYVLAYQNEKVCFAPVTSGTSIGARKGYFTVNSQSSAANFRITLADEEKNATAISEYEFEDDVPQIIFNISGQRVNNIQKSGLYIVNGKTQWINK